MTRRIVVHTANGPVHHLEEVLADDEAQLQRQLKAHPDLLPLEEFGLEGPMMVVGRETSLPSGAADLVGMARSGELLVVEFKTGPDNSDFRHTLAQLLDYGAALWRMDPDAFETTVARRYFVSDHCPIEAPTRNAETIGAAAQATWQLSEDELPQFTERWHRVLQEGAFHYVVAAQRFTATMERTIAHLNDQCRTAQFYAVEVVQFTGADLQAFEARCLLKPARSRDSSTGSTNENELLQQFGDSEYRHAVRELLEFARGQQLVLEWGMLGSHCACVSPASQNLCPSGGSIRQVLSAGWAFEM